MAGYKRRLLNEEDASLKPARLRDLAAEGIDVFCWCNRCGHSATRQAPELADILGDDYPVPEIGARMACSHCSGKDIATRPAWPSVGPVSRHG
jgi:hypothetical protein